DEEAVILAIDRDRRQRAGFASVADDDLTTPTMLQVGEEIDAEFSFVREHDILAAISVDVDESKAVVMLGKRDFCAPGEPEVREVRSSRRWQNANDLAVLVSLHRQLNVVPKKRLDRLAAIGEFFNSVEVHCRPLALGRIPMSQGVGA